MQQGMTGMCRRGAQLVVAELQHVWRSAGLAAGHRSQLRAAARAARPRGAAGCVGGAHLQLAHPKLFEVADARGHQVKEVMVGVLGTVASPARRFARHKRAGGAGGSVRGRGVSRGLAPRKGRPQVLCGRG